MAKRKARKKGEAEKTVIAAYKIFREELTLNTLGVYRELQDAFDRTPEGIEAIREKADKLLDNREYEPATRELKRARELERIYKLHNKVAKELVAA